MMETVNKAIYFSNNAYYEEEVYHMEGFFNYIKSLAKYFQDLVAYFRAKNDGKEDAVMPEFPRWVMPIS